MERTPLVHKIVVLTLVIVPFASLLLGIIFLWNRYVFVEDIALFLGLWLLCSLGVTIGYHRMLTHQSFETKPWVRGIFLILGSMSFDGSPVIWTATHICHHAHSDEEGDPHSPLEGFWHAHFGWLFMKQNFKEAEQYCPQLLSDKLVMTIEKLTPLWITLSLGIPFLIGGWSGLLWGGGIRIFFTNHITWSVNSICHTFGKRDFETTDESRNNWLIGILALGEGWHNNHHAFPTNAFHGMKWWQFDLSGLIIRAFEKVGLVWNVQRVSDEQAEMHRLHAKNRKESVMELRGQLGHSIESTKDEMGVLIEAAVEKGIRDAKLEEVQEFYDKAIRRLSEIQESMERASNLKKQKLNAYAREVQDLAQRMQQIKA